MIVFEIWTGSLYTLAPGDLIRVASVEKRGQDGSVETLWRVVADNGDGRQAYLSRAYEGREKAQTVLDEIRWEIKKQLGEGAPHVFVDLSVF